MFCRLPWLLGLQYPCRLVELAAVASASGGTQGRVTEFGTKAAGLVSGARLEQNRNNQDRNQGLTGDKIVASVRICPACLVRHILQPKFMLTMQPMSWINGFYAWLFSARPRAQPKSDDAGGPGDTAPPSRFWRWTKRALLWGGALAVLGAVFLGFAVGFAAQSIPSYATLQATQPGQTIVVRARDGQVIAIATEGDTEIAEKANDVLYIPDLGEYLTALLAVVPLQLLAYHVAMLKGTDVDQPRNLAKSVTVE